jgi:hypothetical protein
MGTNKITGLGTPTVSTDAATKAYADAIVASAPSNLTGPITSVGAATSIASQTGTGTKFVVDTSPTLVTPVLGVATATSINGTSIPSTKTLVVTTDTLAVHAATTSAQLAGVISDETGSGALVFGTSPTLTTPSISNINAKGDILIGTADNTLGVLTVGNNGESLVADSSTSTGLRWQGDYAAGKNKIINGDFGINQRGFTSTTTSGTYGFDRFLLGTIDGTVTYTPQTFTPGAAPVAGYEGTNFAQIVTTGQTLTTATAQLQQRIESVKTLAGQTATISFYAKANTGTPNMVVNLTQNFGTGGSPSAGVTTAGTVQAITTSWARYSFTIAIPSISGKTLGTTTDGYLGVVIYVSGGSTSAAPTVGIQSNTFQIWGVQVEAGSTATPFQTATGTKAGELAACQRYYQKSYPQTTAVPTNTTLLGQIFGAGTTVVNNAYVTNVALQPTMRTIPTVTIYSYTSSTTAAISTAGGTDLAANSGTTNFISDSNFVVSNTSGGTITAAQGGFLFHYQVVAEL